MSLLNPYVILAAVAAFFVTATGSYLKGQSDCSARYEYAAIKGERDALLDAMRAERTARASDARRLAENEAILQDFQEKADHDAQNLKDGGGVCFAPDDVDSLRQQFRTAR